MLTSEYVKRYYGVALIQQLLSVSYHDYNSTFISTSPDTISHFFTLFDTVRLLPKRSASQYDLKVIITFGLYMHLV